MTGNPNVWDTVNPFHRHSLSHDTLCVRDMCVRQKRPDFSDSPCLLFWHACEQAHTGLLKIAFINAAHFCMAACSLPLVDAAENDIADRIVCKLANF